MYLLVIFVKLRMITNKQLVEIIRALEFYADNDSWVWVNAKTYPTTESRKLHSFSKVIKDGGKRAREMLSTLRARRGAAGVEMEGSPLLVAEDTAAEQAKEIANIQLTGTRRAMAFEAQSILDVSKASAAKARAAGFGRAAVTGAGTTILQGAATTAFRRGQMRGDF